MMLLMLGSYQKLIYVVGFRYISKECSILEINWMDQKQLLNMPYEYTR